MAWYRVFLHGKFNGGLTIDGETMAGFYTNRFVEAPFDKAAVDLAIERLQAEEKFRLLRGQLTADPVITAEVEPSEPRAPREAGTGFVFYELEDE